MERDRDIEIERVSERKRERVRERERGRQRSLITWSGAIFDILGHQRSRTDKSRCVEDKHVMMGDKSEKYLGDWISEHGTSASISETIDNRMKGLKKTINKIKMVVATAKQQATCSNTSLLGNCES